jgi:hypothetical protein
VTAIDTGNGEGAGEGGRREHELLLLCARAAADDATAQAIRRLAGEGLDCEYLFRLAHRHLVLPLLYHQLNRAARDVVPPAFLGKLKKFFRDNAARNIYHAAELGDIIRAFDAHGVEAVPFKGPTLALTAYGNLSLRRFIDLDILVRRGDVRRAKEVLLSKGYELHPPLSAAQERVLMREQHALQFVGGGGLLIVELHWSVVPRKFAASVRAEDLWGRLGKTRLNDSEVPTLSNENLLLSLSAHGTKHLWERLVWICDVAELLNSARGLDWSYVVARARAGGLERMLFLGLRLADELLGARLPVEVRRAAFDDEDVRALASFVRARLFDGAEHRPASFVRNIRFNLRARRRWRDRLRYYGFLFAPTDGDIAALRLPAPMTFAYYLIRPLRLLTKGDDRH